MKTADMTVDDRGYTDLHEHVEELRAKNLLIEIDREINKDTELHPLILPSFVADREETEGILVHEYNVLRV